MSSPKNYGLSDSLINKVTEVCEMSSNRAREYLKASTAQARELQGKIYTPDATEADKRKYRNRSKYFTKALRKSRSIGEDEDMTAEKNYGLSDSLIESARGVREKSQLLDEGREYKAPELSSAGYKYMGTVNTGQMTETLYKHPDGHRIEIHRGNNSRKYNFYSHQPGSSKQYYHKNLQDALKKNGHLTEETLNEGRGRPRKTPLAAGEEEGNEPDQNIIMQLRKVQSLRGAKPVSFRDGSKHTVHMADAMKALRMHSMMRTSIEKGNFENKIAKSHADFKHHIGSTINAGGSEEEKKSKVTLPAINRLKARGKLEEASLDDVWKKAGNNSRMRLGNYKKPEPYSVAKHNENVEKKRSTKKASREDIRCDLNVDTKDGKGFFKEDQQLDELSKSTLKNYLDRNATEYYYNVERGKRQKKSRNKGMHLALSKVDGITKGYFAIKQPGTNPNHK